MYRGSGDSSSRDGVMGKEHDFSHFSAHVLPCSAHGIGGHIRFVLIIMFCSQLGGSDLGLT